MERGSEDTYGYEGDRQSRGLDESAGERPSLERDGDPLHHEDFVPKTHAELVAESEKPRVPPTDEERQPEHPELSNGEWRSWRRQLP